MEKRRVDLHTHSIYSDGCDEPVSLINVAKENNVSVLALTDHDNIDGSKELIQENKKEIYIYSGVELTAKVKKGRMHILGYNIDLDNPNLNSRLKEIRETSIYNMLLYIELLKKDYNIIIQQNKIDELLSLKGNVGRPQLALILIEMGYCKEVQECFDKYLTPVYEKARNLKKGIEQEEAITLIKEAGGVASLAHPGTLKLTPIELKRELLKMKQIGLECIEVIHSNTSIEMRKYYYGLAQELELLISGGTDYHGYSVKPDITLGHGRNENVEIYSNDLSLTKNIKSRYM